MLIVEYTPGDHTVTIIYTVINGFYTSILISMIDPGLVSHMNIFRLSLLEPIPVAAQSYEPSCGLSLAGIASSNPTGDIDVCLLCVLCFHIDVSVSG